MTTKEFTPFTPVEEQVEKADVGDHARLEVEYEDHGRPSLGDGLRAGGAAVIIMVGIAVGWELGKLVCNGGKNLVGKVLKKQRPGGDVAGVT
jgi:hypothetical protein